jgi:hypothetical protein
MGNKRVSYELTRMHAPPTIVCFMGGKADITSRMLAHITQCRPAVTHFSIGAFLKRQMALKSRTADGKYVLNFSENTGKLHAG